MAREPHPNSAGPLIARPACLADAASIAQRLRAADRAEFRAGTGHDEVEGALRAAVLSEALTLVAVDANAVPVLFFGISLPTDAAWPFATYFMVAVEGVERFARQIARESRLWIAALQEATGGLPGHNYVDARNALHIRWLQWCGAVFTGRRVFRADPDTPFLEFILPCALIPSPPQPSLQPQ